MQRQAKTSQDQRNKELKNMRVRNLSTLDTILNIAPQKIRTETAAGVDEVQRPQS